MYYDMKTNYDISMLDAQVIHRKAKRSGKEAASSGAVREMIDTKKRGF